MADVQHVEVEGETQAAPDAFDHRLLGDQVRIARPEGAVLNSGRELLTQANTTHRALVAAFAHGRLASRAAFFAAGV